MSVTHINIRGNRRHDASPDCWCSPSVSTFRYRTDREDTTVIDHHDAAHQSVTDDLNRGGVLPHEPTVRILGAKKVS